jgi:hypothetical protein
VAGVAVSARGLFGALGAFAYWAWATFALVMAWLAAGFSENLSDERKELMVALACLSWVIASVALAWMLSLRRGRRVLLVLWAVQAGMLAVAFYSPHDGFAFDEWWIQSAGVAGQVGGLLAIALFSSRTAKPRDEREAKPWRAAAARGGLFIATLLAAVLVPFGVVFLVFALL